MKNTNINNYVNQKKGISLISLVVTIIAIIILASIIIYTGLYAPNKASLASFMQEISDFRTAVMQDYMNKRTKYALNDIYRSDAQIFYTIANGGDESIIENIDEQPSEDLTSGQYANVFSLETLGLKGKGIEGTYAFLIEDDNYVENWHMNRRYYEKGETHWITDKGDVFVLKGFHVADDGREKYYLNERIYIEEELSSPQDLKSFYTITFDYKNGTEVVTRRNVEGRLLKRPTTPEKEGYGFDNWYYREGLIEHVFDFTVPPTTDMELYAKYTGEAVLGKSIPDPYRSQASKIQFIKDDFENIPNDAEVLDDLQKKNCARIACYAQGDGKGGYVITVLSPNTIYANSSMGHYFNGYLETVVFSNFDTRDVTNMGGMFYACGNLKNVNLSDFDTSNVTNMGAMFYGCRNLNNIDVSHFDTSKVTNMSWMFGGCNNLTNLDVSHFDTSKVTDMQWMFVGCNNLSAIDVSHFDTKNVTNMSRMFEGCNKVSKLDVGGFYTNNVTDMSTMFLNCNSLTALDVSNFDTSNVTSMRSMFAGCNNLESLNVSNLNNAKVTNMNSMFSGCNVLKQLDITGFTTSQVTDMASMFSNCKNLATLNLSSFNTSNVTNMSSMFNHCTQLTSLDLNNFDTSNVTNMSSMFNVCEKLTSLTISNFNTSNVTTMSSMFFCCNSLSNIDVSKFDTSNVTNMSNMFYRCLNLKEADLSSFNTVKVTNMGGFFQDDGNISTVWVGTNWTTENVSSSSGMFNGCAKLTGGAGTKYDGSHRDKEYARIDGGESAPGYFTLKTN
ncbi:MAG: BspA family leucine-rich repeat surface protein [Clostridia bacterium]|nr:BspA family leucine-rich repeat surface protein [Clostridia bacterium]